MMGNMVEPFGVAEVGVVDAPAQPAPVNTDRVKKWLLDYVNTAESHARTVSENNIWNRVRASDNAYGITRKAIDPQDAGIKAASLEKEAEIRTEDLADQVDSMVAIFSGQLNTSDPVCRLVPRSGITEQQADLMAQVQDALLKEKDFDKAKQKFCRWFVHYCYAGLKVCSTTDVSYMTERVIVPVVPNYTDDALAMRGYFGKGALASALAEDGLNFVGIADKREDGTYTNLLCTKCDQTEESHVYIKAINPKHIAISDPSRPFCEQQHIHEYYYLTMTELENCGFQNLDQIEKKGVRVSTTSDLRASSDTSSSDEGAPLIHDTYKAVESWLEIPWEKGIRANKFTEDELRALAIECGFSPNEYRYRGQKWCVFHSCGQVLMSLAPNYLAVKSEFPYDGESFVPGDGINGQSMLERISSVVAGKLAVLNLNMRTIKQNLFQSMIFSGSMGLTEGDLKALQTPGGKVVADMNVDVASDMHVFTVPDTTASGMNMVGYLDRSISALGVPAVLTGEGKADTATQDAINNRRGQTVVNEAFSRMMSVFRTSYRKHLQCFVNRFTTSRYIPIAGENGASITNRWVMPSELTDKLDIEPVAALDDGSKQRMSQLFMGLMNIMAQVFGTQSMKAMLSLILRYNRVPESDIAKIEDAEGSLTNTAQEIEAMLQDPDLQVEVRMDDPHPICIQAAMMALMQEQQRAAMYNIPFTPPQNVIEYIQMHEAMLKQQEIMAAMQQVMSGGGGPSELKGKPKQGRSDGGPGTEEGGARQDGQSNGNGNQGPMSAAGLTGQGAVPGVPAGV